MVYKGKSQSKMDDNWGYPYDLGNLHLPRNITRHPTKFLLLDPENHYEGRLVGVSRKNWS